MNDIKDALTRVADASAPAPLSLDDVRGRARRIRRRRTATALVASAAAVAAIAGIGVAVSSPGSDDGSRPPIAKTPTAPPAPRPAGDADAVGPVVPVTLDVDADRTFGGEPLVPYWADGRIVDTDGSATPFPDRPSTFAKDPHTGDWVVVRPEEAHAELVRITPAGEQVGAPVPTFPRGLAVAPDGELVTLTAHNTRVTLTEGGRSLDLGTGFEFSQIFGVLPNTDVLFQGVDGSVQVAHLDVGQAGPVDGAATAVVSKQVAFVAQGLEDGSWRMEDEDGATRWTLDWAGVSSFSPDDRYVALTGDPQQRIPGGGDWDSEATDTLWIRTAADLLPVTAFTAPEGGYFWSWTWDGDDLLATVFLDGEWTLVRLSADGYTVGRGTARAGDGEEPPYVFATS